MTTAGGAAHVVAQVKINLLLRVLAREASGFHGLETVFCRLELGDDVVVRALDRADRALDCRGADVGPVERNLAWRAATAYQARTGWPRGFAIEIEKRIPVGGGLGGGSADAGAVLRALNALAPEPLPADALLALAMPLGSDVPFLTTEAPLALAWSRGERMFPLAPLPPRRVVLATFAEGVATADAYRWVAESRGAWAPEPAVVPPAALASWEGMAGLAANDFEPAVFAHVPPVRAAHLALAAGDAEGAATAPPIVRMSGSGATVFRVDDGAPALDVLRQRTEAASGCRVVATRTAPSVVPVRRVE